MCGIVGFIQRSLDSDTLTRMKRHIRHRGPDDHGVWIGSTAPNTAVGTDGGWHVHLGHQRLSILDLAGGHQPLSTPEQNLWIVFNGEIFNYLELIDRFHLDQHFQFTTRSDTEVIVRLYQFLYESRAEKTFAELNGMFAFALWNGSSGELILARDSAGIKPLYYAPLSGGGLAFGSELAAVAQHSGVSREIDRTALANFFFLDYVHPPRTMLAGVLKLEPGTMLVWKAGRFEIRPFYRPFQERPVAAETSTLLPTRAPHFELWERLSTAVRRQRIADVPVGVFLSGGIDSSSVAAIAQAQSSEPIQTFSIAFDDPSHDESTYARLVAQHLGTQHFEERLTADALLERFDSIYGLLDEPLADPSLLPTHVLSELAAKHVKVALGGDAGDELFAGYPTMLAHRAALVADALPQAWTTTGVGLLKRAANLLPVRDRYQSLEWKLKRILGRWDGDPMLRHLRWMSNVDVGELAEIEGGARNPNGAGLRGHASAITDFIEAVRQGIWNPICAVEANPLARILRLDFATYMSGSVLTKVDRASMAHGLEVRPPFLDQDFVQWAFAQPMCFKLHGINGKYLLKKAAERHLPHDVVWRKKKGFSIPLAPWTRGPLKARLEAVLNSSPLWDHGLLRRDTFQGWMQEHQTFSVDRSRPLWALLILDRWLAR